jgi:hypothetical protein
MKYDRIASEISSKLQLTSPAVALSFVEAAPAGMTSFDQDVPSACAPWCYAQDGSAEPSKQA